jgi:succinoglycan biosynthesis protein ExoM
MQSSVPTTSLVGRTSLPGDRHPAEIRAGSAIMHLSVCICTYRRPAFLARLLAALASQETGGLFNYSVVVVDNDRAESARAAVVPLAETYPVPLIYAVEPEQSIARARNRAVTSAHGDFLAFIDDDELPIRCWLLELFKTCITHRADGVLGPVKPHFDSEPPVWITRGKFYERASYPTGFVIEGGQGRTGNVLLKRSLFRPGEPAFRPEFVTGEDQDFFRRRIAEGHVFIWCSEAVAFEVVPPSRWRRSYLLRKALMRGRYSLIEPTFGVLDAGKSLVAIPVYGAALPLLAVLGHQYLMRCLEKLAYHLGKLLALLRLNPVGGTYISE